jgi:hypothetical protein
MKKLTDVDFRDPEDLIIKDESITGLGGSYNIDTQEDARTEDSQKTFDNLEYPVKGDDIDEL